MQGAGNDFVIIDIDVCGEPSSAQCRALADRHFGVGCDMILGVYRDARAPALGGYRIWTSQGDPSSQCANGARCVAAWVHRAGWTEERQFVLESPSGIHAVGLESGGRVRFELGVPELDQGPAATEVAGPDGSGVRLDYDTVSVGNPHAVIVVDDVDAVAIDRVPDAIRAATPLHPEVNIGFVEITDPREVRLRVHEFGAGATLSCASGAGAAVAVLSSRGLVPTGSVRVSQPGGPLEVSWAGAASPIYVEGPVVRVYEGELDIAAL